TATYNTATNNITGTGGITLLGGGALNLGQANDYGTSTGLSDPKLSGGTTIRNGTILVGNNTALSATTVELGDAVYPKASVQYATAGASVLGVERTIAFTADGRSGLGGGFISDGSGLFDGAGG